MILTLSGIGVSDGIAIGRIHRLSSGELELPEYHLEKGDLEAEVERLRRAVKRAEQTLSEMEQTLQRAESDPARELLQTHRLMINDDLLVGEATRMIRAEKINAEWALDRQAAVIRREFERIEDDYLAMRIEDLDQIVRLLQRELAEQPLAQLAQRIPHQLDQTVVMAEALSPAELALLQERKVAGLITEHGGVWSHSAIVARSLGIPMVMAVHHAGRLLREDESVILDSHYGVVLATEDERLHEHYAEKSQAVQRNHHQLERFLKAPDRTRDGKRFRLFGNAELEPELIRCRESGVVGIGLMRTEFMFGQNQLVNEDAQYQIFSQAVETLDGRVLTIRTLDAGGDKLPKEMRHLHGPNPALGLRGLRMSLAMQETFQTQIRAILRASKHGPLRILLPMLTRVDEIQQARALIAQCREQLQMRGVRPDPDVPIGGMIETPAAALMAAQLARELDFISVGTNDLVQYVLAVDRQDELVHHLFKPAHRSVIELLHRIAQAAERVDRPVQVCGEMAGDPQYIRLLLGLGLTEFSMPPAHLAAIKANLIQADAGTCVALVQRYLENEDDEIGQALLLQLSE
ncbi:MAG: phosphoenolpyruvate--protein phosphotransferase [Pseudomonadota bacterium]